MGLVDGAWRELIDRNQGLSGKVGGPPCSPRTRRGRASRPVARDAAAGGDLAGALRGFKRPWRDVRRSPRTTTTSAVLWDAGERRRARDSFARVRLDPVHEAAAQNLRDADAALAAQDGGTP